MSRWDEGQDNYKKQRRRLRRAKTKGDPQEILKVALEGLASFDTYGWPDSWTEWQRAADDAVWALEAEAWEPTKGYDF